MINSEKFYEAFDPAGFLKPASWTPSPDLGLFAATPGTGATQTAKVRFKSPTQDVLAGVGMAEDYSIEYPSSVFVGLRRGEALTVDGVKFTVRADPREKLDGSVRVAELTKVAPTDPDFS